MFLCVLLNYSIHIKYKECISLYLLLLSSHSQWDTGALRHYIEPTFVDANMCIHWWPSVVYYEASTRALSAWSAGASCCTAGHAGPGPPGSPLCRLQRPAQVEGCREMLQLLRSWPPHLWLPWPTAMPPVRPIWPQSSLLRPSSISIRFSLVAAT
jgi:hypothetical protein